MGSKTTLAPAARANSAVLSFELLSQTMISVSHPRSRKTSAAALMCCRVSAMRRSSLNAGITIEIFKPKLHMLDDIISELRALDFRTAFHLSREVVGDAFG